MVLSSHKKLIAYSGAANIFLLCSTVQSQVVYTDFDPDIIVNSNDIFDLDINSDGITDIQFEGEQFWSWTSFGGSGSGFSTQEFKLLNFASVAYESGISYLRPMFLNTDDNVDSSKPFVNYENMRIFSAYNEFDEGAGGIDSDVSIYSGDSLVNTDSYIGVKLIISGQQHYGWGRINLVQIEDGMPYLAIKDVAYNSTPDELIEIDPYTASEAKNPELSDIGETNTAADLQLTFEKATDESTISTYRIILYTGSDPDLAEANALAPDRYTEIIPTGSDITLIFNDETQDIGGNLLLPGTNYSAIVLSVADGIVINYNALSLPSPDCSYNLIDAPYPYSVYLSDISNNMDITDLKVNFSTYSTLGVAEYKIIISDDDDMNFDDLLMLDSTYFQTLNPDGLSYILYPDTSTNIYECINPHLFEEYYAYVISMPDLVYSSYPAISSYPGHCTFVNPEYDEQPVITISNITGTASDINVQFPKFDFEEDLISYRIVVIEDEYHNLFDNTDAAYLADFKFMEVFPSGEDLNINLSSGQKDFYGKMIEPGIVYRLFVVLRGGNTPPFYSMAIPSEAFSLSEPVKIISTQADNNITLENNILHIDLINNKSQNLNIVNVQGQTVFQQPISPENQSIDLGFLSSGIYFCFFESNEKKQVFKVMIN